jgi:hypothetical protein
MEADAAISMMDALSPCRGRLLTLPNTQMGHDVCVGPSSVHRISSWASFKRGHRFVGCFNFMLARACKYHVHKQFGVAQVTSFETTRVSPYAMCITSTLTSGP